MRKTVYLDATIPSYLFDERKNLREYVGVTKKWWSEESAHFEVYVSEETIAELSEGDYPHRDRILEFAAQLRVLPSDERILEIARVYLDNYLMPQVLKGDALHLAYAVFYKCDFLLTWNCNHLANANKRQHIRIVNARLNLPTPEIVTPLELFTEDNHDHE
ncbi:type II toxin-antitoxin system VapC family toxin [Candidatus Sumerlaeota bacterium]|nr:type II toxin-antitoxin system VapC family toxin [Candidatus Sumerlaeota bacterium]